MKKQDISSPALIMDYDLFENNIKRMAEYFERRPAKLRPHFKAHRCPEISRRQLRAGAIGITCAKLAEAEHLAELGFDHLLIANEIAGREKLERFARLSRKGLDVIVGVDSLVLARALNQTGLACRHRLSVVLDMDIGMHRCGLPPGPELRRLARFCAAAKGLKLRGIMGYEGHLAGRPDNGEKAQLVRESLSQLTGFAGEMRVEGIPIEIVSAGGTGTYQIAGACPGITEIQAGSYCVMEPAYLSAGAKYDLASTILTTIISRPRRGVAIGDAGRKSIQPSHGMPQVKSIKGAVVTGLHAEHCIIQLSRSARQLRIGEKIELYVPYVDGAFNLHDTIHVCRNDRVVATWKISGRNCST